MLGRDDSRSARIYGSNTFVRGEHENTVIYELENGSLLGEFFGRPLGVDDASGVLAAVNRNDEVMLLHVSDAAELHRYNFTSPVRGAVFAWDGKSLMVLTADQRVHVLPLAGNMVSASRPTPPQASN